MTKKRIWILVIFLNGLLLCLLMLQLALSTAHTDKTHGPAANMRTIATAYKDYTTSGPQTPAVTLSSVEPVAPSATPPATTSTPTAAPVTYAVPNAAAAASMRQIGMAFASYMSRGNSGQMLTANPGDTAHAAVAELAKVVFINNAAEFFVPGDPKGPNPRPKTVLIGDPQANPQINPEFANATLSVELAANIPLNAPATTTPIAWTRGLRDDGTWAPDSPFGGVGGYIVYMDGHTEWVTSLNIHEKLPPGAVILSAEPNGAQR